MTTKTNNYVMNNPITNTGSIAASNTYPSNTTQGSTYYNTLDTYQFRNGYVCYKLNNNTISPFHQNFYSDPYPVLDNTHQLVYLYDGYFYNTLYALSSYNNVLFFYQILDSGYI